MAVKLDRKGLRMLGYGIVDIEISRNNIWSAVIEPLRDGQYTLKLKELIGKLFPESEAREIYEEILNHKWLATETLVKAGKLEAGSSLTLPEAAKEWMTLHYPAWKAARPTLMELTEHEENISAPSPELPEEL